MVLGLRSKSKKGFSFPIDFYIQVQEIKPWPVRQQIAKAGAPLLLQWQRGDKRSGNTCAALPEESPDGGRIVFHESFRLPATLYREETKGSKSSAPAKFQKKCVVFSLYETSLKGAKLGTAVLDLADFASATAFVSTNIPLALAKKGPTGVSSSLFLAIGPFGIRTSLSRTGSASGRGNITAGTSASSGPAADLGPDADAGEGLVAALASDENEEIAAFTDDEEKFHSSSSPTLGAVPDSGLASTLLFSSPSYPKLETNEAAQISISPSNARESQSLEQLHQNVLQSAAGITEREGTSHFTPPRAVQFPSATSETAATARVVKRVLRSAAGIAEALPSDEKRASPARGNLNSFEIGNKLREDTRSFDRKTETKVQAFVVKAISEGITGEEVPKAQGKVVGEAKLGGTGRRADVDVPTGKSSTGAEGRRVDEKAQGDFRVLQEARARLAKGVDGEKITERFENKALDEAIRKLEIAEEKIVELQAHVSTLSTQLNGCEAELTDLAAAEIALYSVVPEHGGTPHKLHSPARRLARLYMHAFKLWTLERRAGSAQNSVAAIVSVVRGCGHDVPRLTFWLSNVVVLRESLLQACSPAAPSPDGGPGGSKHWHTRIIDFAVSAENSLRGSSCQIPGKQDSTGLSLRGQSNVDWKELNTYTAALERIEAWIHSRVIECVWWQAMAPPMQRSLELSPISSPRTNSVDDKLIGRSTSSKSASELGDGRQGNISVEIWKKALLKVYKRACPVRAAGHDCGCLQSLITLIVEQCAARLDVAIFNALLRDASDFVPTDPLSDPIGDASVLPVAPGKLTFGDGARLKNAVGTWSSWLAGVLGTGDETASGEVYNHDNDVGSVDEVDKGSLYFMLCRATADLLMLPKDILMDKSVRKEVCPVLSVPLIRRILSIFEPDEFFPDPVSPSLLAALNAEVTAERRRQGECGEDPGFVPMASAPKASYVPPHPASVQEIIGQTAEWNRLNKSTSIMRKGYTSDDELEDLESPASSMLDTVPGLPWPTQDRPTQDLSTQGRKMSMFGQLGRGSSYRDEEFGIMKRFRLLRKVWASH